MTPLSRVPFLALLALAAVALPASAQDGGGTAPVSQEPAAPSGAGSEILDRMERLYPRVLRQPATEPTPGETDQAKAERGKAMDDWDVDVEALAKAGDDYLKAIGDSAADPMALFYRGVGKAIRAKRAVPKNEIPSYYAAAADSLRRYLAATDEKAVFRTDAEMWLGEALIGGGTLDEALPHARKAVELLRKDGRVEDAGRTAHSALAALRAASRDADFAAFAEAVKAGEADFGASTETMRKHAAAAGSTVGKRLPALPDVADVDGKKIEFRPGKPLLVHFFLTGYAHGATAAGLDVEKTLVPLIAQYGGKGLAIVGVAMDLEIDAAKAQEMRAKWVEWGRKSRYSDGSLAMCREWAEKKGVAWPWYWDGKWLKNPISLALGGVGTSGPHAILVDAEGVIRWRGDAQKDGTYSGLADEVAKLPW